MIYYVTPIVDIKENDFTSFLKPSLTSSQISRIWAVDNTMGQSIFEKYNYAIEAIKDFNSLDSFKDDDVIVFLHSDVSVKDEFIEEKLNYVFENDKELGMVGVYGTTLLTENGGWWMADRSVYGRGHIIQGMPNKTEHHMVDRIGYFDDVVSIDGCFMAIRGSVLEEFRFDEYNYDGYHFYDVDTSLQIGSLGYKIAVVDILIRHESEGPLDQGWERNRNICMNKWKKRGIKFPFMK